MPIDDTGLQSYVRLCVSEGVFGIPADVENVCVQNLEKLGSSGFNDTFSFTLSYVWGGREERKHFILKQYTQAMDYNGPDVYKKCFLEYDIMFNLKRMGYPVPRVYVYEMSPSFTGYPFIIMDKEKVLNISSTEVIDSFASNLARLHNFSVEELGISSLPYPESSSAFASKILSNIGNLIKTNKYPKFLGDSFKLGLRLLNDRAANCSCPRYSLIHGDYKPLNSFVVEDSRLLTIDFEVAQIGDPAYDVGYAYHAIKLSNQRNIGEAARIAERFLQVYLKEAENDVSDRLDFYKIVGIINPALFHAINYINPKIVGRGSVSLLFPFVGVPFVARFVFGKDGYPFLLRYFKSFIDSYA